jgi:antagonist of KipI
MSLTILDTGLSALLVDFGRPRWRSLGVPVGGAADSASLSLGNALLGNPPDAVAVEITLTGPTLRAEVETACSVFGAPFTLTCGRRSLRRNATFTLQPGEVLRIGGTPRGARAYFCVHGGLQVLRVLESGSGLEPLRAGTLLECSTSRVPVRFLAEKPCMDEGSTLRVLPGAQADWFFGTDFHEQEYQVTPASNRMGLRLAGHPLRLPDRELVSEPVCPGAVQVTRDGQCIVLGVDGQTIGGYPKVAQVISADLDRLGQLRPGERVRFAPVGLEAAETAFHRRQMELRKWLVRLALATK